MPYYEDENKFPGLKKALEDSNKSTREYQLKFIDQNLEFAKEMYDEDDEYYQYLETSVIDHYDESMGMSYAFYDRK